ncbi:MAG: hypothetical protein ACTSPD_12185 [Promethearchaeota archaeon]
MKLLFRFFPDLYIHDIFLEKDDNTGENILYICFLSYEERGIAVGKNGDYIKAVNKIFSKYIAFKGPFSSKIYQLPIRIKCVLSPFTKEPLSNQ